MPKVPDARFAVIDLTVFGVGADATLIGLDDAGNVAYNIPSELFTSRLLKNFEVKAIDFYIHSISSNGYLSGWSRDEESPLSLGKLQHVSAATSTSHPFPVVPPSGARDPVKESAIWTSNGEMTLASGGLGFWTGPEENPVRHSYSGPYILNNPFNGSPKFQYIVSNATSDYGRIAEFQPHSAVVNAAGVIWREPKPR